MAENRTVCTAIFGGVQLYGTIVSFHCPSLHRHGDVSHIAMTMRGREVKAYINGVLASQGTLTGDPITTTDIPFHIGGNLHSYPNGNIHSFHGQVAEVATYNREVTAQEFLEYVNNGKYFALDIL